MTPADTWRDVPNVDPASTNGHVPDLGGHAGDLGPDVDPLLVDVVSRELGVDGPAAAVAALGLADRVRTRHLQRLADQIVAGQTAGRDQRLDHAHVATGAAFLAESDQPSPPLLGELVGEGHNATLAAQYKAGKTTLVANAAAALITGEQFLARFPTQHPRRVALLNYELTADDQRALIRALNLPTDTLDRLLILNLRGVRLSLTTPTGRDWLVTRLAEHHAQVAIVDTYGAAVAPSVDSENDNAAARRFLATLDEIKHDAGCPSAIVTAHTGRKLHDEGAEHARGATVLDDWADVRLILTKDRTTGTRFLASEGRGAYDLPESAVRYDPATRGLWLADADLGQNRADQRAYHAADTVATLVSDQPGINTGDLRAALEDRGITNNGNKSAAITKARTRALIHTHRTGRQVQHHPGPVHPEEQPCT